MALPWDYETWPKPDESEEELEFDRDSRGRETSGEDSNDCSLARGFRGQKDSVLHKHQFAGG